MKNPMNRRYLRELRDDLGRYIVIFLFILLMISAVSGFIVADNSVYTTYNAGFERYNVEDGHLSFDKELTPELKEKIESNSDITLYNFNYFDEVVDNLDKTEKTKLRIYKASDRENINKICLMSGCLPDNKNEIAIDRMFAENNHLTIGDSISINNKTLKITGMVSLVDYTSLYENNSDSMFNAINFGVGIMTNDGYDSIASKHIIYNYSYKYKIAPVNDKENKEFAEDLIENLKESITEYDKDMFMETMDKSKFITVNDVLPRYMNQAINFAGEDMGSDKEMILLFEYLVILLLAFIFAITTSNSITKEASVIGTLRASGYSRAELLRHYMLLPILVTLVAGIIGNILGYTVMEDVFRNLYYNNYSLASYEPLFSMDAFLNTTLIPLIIMLVINFIVLSLKLRLNILAFLRRDLKKHKKEKAFRLPSNIKILKRFRIRIIFQNLKGYLVMLIGIIMSGTVIILGLMFGTMFKEYSERINSSQIANYQYILSNSENTDINTAERYCLTTLNSDIQGFLSDEISIYGIENNSRYIKSSIAENDVLLSNGMMEKFNLKTGDELSLYDKYEDKYYSFTITGQYQYDAGLAVFISKDCFNKTFNKESDYYTGYFSDEKLTDIDESNIKKIITIEDLTKLSSQMEKSFGDMLIIFEFFGVIMFILVMYILSKQIIEGNSQSISMTKILGFTNLEIGSLYIIATSIVVVLSLLISMPLNYMILKWLFSNYLYTKISGYIPFIVTNDVYITMFALGILSYILVAILQFVKINRIPKSDALKNVE